MTKAEKFAELMEARGWRVHCYDPSAPAQDTACDFLIIEPWLYAMTPEASRWMDWLDAELGDVTMRKTWRERQRPTAAGTADGSRLLPLMSRFNGLQCRCRIYPRKDPQSC